MEHIDNNFSNILLVPFLSAVVFSNRAHVTRRKKCFKLFYFVINTVSITVVALCRQAGGQSWATQIQAVSEAFLLSPLSIYL